MKWPSASTLKSMVKHDYFSSNGLSNPNFDEEKKSNLFCFSFFFSPILQNTLWTYGTV